jgi:acetyl esterase/lipase
LRIFLLAIALFVVSTVSAAQSSAADRQPSREEQERAFIAAVMKPLVYRVPGMEQVQTRKDIPYRTVAGKPMLADVYSPPGAPSGALPVVFFIHGGVDDSPPRPKDWGMYQSWGKLVAASGMIAVTFNQRTGFPEPHTSEAASDVLEMVAFVRQHAAELHADANRVCLASFSAGGPNLSMALRGEMPNVRCLLAFYSLLDIKDNEFHKRFDTSEELQRYSPTQAVLDRNGNIPPIFVARAGHDQIPRFNEFMVRFIDAAVTTNAPMTLVIHPTVEHGF